MLHADLWMGAFPFCQRLSSPGCGDCSAGQSCCWRRSCTVTFWEPWRVLGLRERGWRQHRRRCGDGAGSEAAACWDRLCIWILCVIFLGQQGGDHCIPQVVEVLAQLCVQEPLPQLFYHLDVFRLFLALSHVFGYDPQKLPVPLSLTSLSSRQSPRAVQTPLQFFSHLWHLPSL